MATVNSVGKGRPVEIVYLDLCKVFNTLSQNFLIEKLMNNELDKWTVR